MVTAQRFTIVIEEKLLLKLLSFFGYGKTEAGQSLAEAHCENARVGVNKQVVKYM